MEDNKHKQPLSNRSTTSLHALTTAALILPGLLQAPAQAADDDEVDFQYSHYQEGKRDIYSSFTTFEPGVGVKYTDTKLPQNLNPIEVDSLHGSAKITLTDRVKFAFNYLQDTWSGATPIGTVPAVSAANNPKFAPNSDRNVSSLTGASPYASPGNGNEYMFVDKKLNLYHFLFDQNGNPLLGKPNNQLTHVLSFASPETRKQGDFKLTYEWDEAALSVGGGISVENDYESRFGNIGGLFNFNQKQTTLNWGLSYTNSDTHATLDPDAFSYYSSFAYETNILLDPIGPIIIHTKPRGTTSGYVENILTPDPNSPNIYNVTSQVLRGNRQDWGVQLGLSQILNRNSVLTLDLSYNRSTGYLGNPYKLVFVHELSNQYSSDITSPSPNSMGYIEVRPDLRNQFNWHLGYTRYVEPLDAAFHFNYHFAHDDWGIQAHTFEGDWVQPLGEGWSITPRIRYYSQTAADFYTTGFYVDSIFKQVGDQLFLNLPKTYSSDQRLSGFGTLSGGVTLSKQFAKGVSLETGFEYYTHQGGLKLGGGGEQDFADFDYWVANAALKVNLGALNAGGGSHDGHGEHHHHSNSPAGVMFDHTLPKAGDFMAGYRFMRSEQAGDLLFGSHPVGLDEVNLNGCEGKECAVTPNFMAMSMHMLDLMYAPTDWLTLMLMPQWMDMEMTMTANPNVQITGGHGGHAGHGHQTGGIGDFGFYALFKAFDHPNHHLTVSLGGTAPTGDVDITLRKTGTDAVYNRRIHYGMQLGSGTWDFKPALTYTGEMNQFLWGAQANATIRLEDSNDSGFALGDIFQGSIWGGYNWTDWLATTVRGVYTSQGKIKGAYPASTEIDINTGLPFVPQHIGPFDFPGNYGGQFVDLGLGINVTVPSGAFQGNTLKFEWLQPVHTDYNGYQLDRDYTLNFTWSVGF